MYYRILNVYDDREFTASVVTVFVMVSPLDYKVGRNSVFVFSPLNVLSLV